MRLLFVCLLSMGVLSATSAQKIGYTNVELLMNYMPEVQSVQKELDEYGKIFQKKLSSKEDYYKHKLAEYYEKAQTSENTAALKDLENELMKLQEEIQNDVAEAERAILQKQQELMKPILEKIQKAVNEIAEEGNFTYILNQTTGNNILFGLESMDVTRQLAEKLGIPLPE